jgi:hypothetical protein
MAAPAGPDHVVLLDDGKAIFVRAKYEFASSKLNRRLRLTRVLYGN